MKIRINYAQTKYKCQLKSEWADVAQSRRQQTNIIRKWRKKCGWLNRLELTFERVSHKHNHLVGYIVALVVDNNIRPMNYRQLNAIHQHGRLLKVPKLKGIASASEQATSIISNKNKTIFSINMQVWITNSYNNNK